VGINSFKSMDATSTNTLLATAWGSIGSILETNIGLILVIAVAVFAVVFLFKLGKRLIAGR